jgi:hypothetical protein
MGNSETKLTKLTEREIQEAIRLTKLFHQAVQKIKDSKEGQQNDDN